MKKILHITTRILLWLFGTLVGVLLLVAIGIQFQAVQQKLIHVATSYVSDKTHTRVEIGRISISFPKNIVLQDVFVEDQQHDTLASIHELSVGADFFGLLKGNIAIGDVSLNGVTSRIHRTLPDSTFNFDFLIDAFVSGNSPKQVDTTASEPLALKVGTVHLSDIKFTYDDAVSGVYTNNTIGDLRLSMESIDLDHLAFNIDELYLERITSLVELKPTPKVDKEPVDTSALPFFAANKIVFKEVDFTFKNPSEAMLFRSRIGELELVPNRVDLNAQQVDIRSLVLNQSYIQLEMIDQNKPAEKEDTVGSSLGWSVVAQSLSLDDNIFKYDITNIPKLAKGIDYNHLLATHIGIDARSIAYNTNGIKGDIRRLTVDEQSGISIQKLRTRFMYDTQHAELANLYVQTSHSKITNYLGVAYSSIDAIAKHPDNLEMNLHFDNTSIAMQDVLVFVPDLAKDPLIAKNTKQQIVLNGRIKGKLSDLQLSNFIVQTASQTAIAIDGRVKGLPNVDALWVDVNIPLFSTSPKDLELLMPDSIIPSSIQVPQKIMIIGQVRGGLKDIYSNLNVQTNDGSVKLIATYKLKDTVPFYDFSIQPSRLDIGAIVKQPMVGKVSGTIEAKGHSFNPKEMTATVTSTLSLLELNQYAYTGLVFDATANDGLIHSSLKVKDENIDLTMNADGSLQSSHSYATIGVSVAGANFKQLKLTEGDYKTSGELKVNLYDILGDKLSGNVGIGKVVVLNNQQKYVLDSLLVMSINEKRNITSTDVLLKAQYNGQTQLQHVPDVLEYCLSHYWGKPVSTMDVSGERFTCILKVNSHPILTDMLVPELGQFSGIDCKVDYTGKNNALAVVMNAPLVEYDQTTFKNVRFNIQSDKDTLLYETAVQSISSSNYFIDRTRLSGNVANQQLRYDINIIDPDSGYKLKVTGRVQQHGDSIVLKWLNDYIVLNNQRWDVNKNNTIVIHPKGINVQQFDLAHQQQFLKVNSMGVEPNAHLNIGFGNFDLAALSQIIEKDSAIVQGVMNGKIELNPSDKFAFVSDLTITRIVMKGIPVGNLSVKADNQSGNRYNAQITLSGNENDATINGYYESKGFNFNLDINKINLRSIEAFMPNTIRRSNGYITGALKLSGEPDRPEFNGEIGLKEASFNIAALNNRLAFADERILLKKEGIQFKNFTALDSMGQPLVVNGFIYTNNFSDMKYELDITTEKFRVLSTTEKENPLYYGTILLNSVIKIRGTDKLPKIKADVKLIDGSDLTFVVQQGDLDMDRGEGVVVFVDTTANTIMKDTVSAMVSGYTGLNITASIEVNKNTKFKIITDKVSGDNLVVSGDALMQFGIDESGKISLVGAYVLNSGSYKASLQKIAKRDFIIKQGSTITWGGDPLDGLIDITATYKTRTGATDILAAELMGVPEDQRAQYRKLLNYDVNLIIKGFLLKPELKFNLDMPLKDQQAFNGMVYAKINQINNDENELNKQVFSLLVLGQFLPVGTGTGVSTTSAVSSIARNSVNQLFSDQLNTLSGKYIKGAELNFNLQSTDDYTAKGTQQSTELQIGLKKELFNNRVIVKVGSNIDVGATANQTSTQNITGDMMMEYKITEDGTYRFKAFRENGYEGIIDGLLYKTGIGILYSKDYDSISQLFSRPKKEEALKLKEEKVE